VISQLRNFESIETSGPPGEDSVCGEFCPQRRIHPGAWAYALQVMYRHNVSLSHGLAGSKFDLPCWNGISSEAKELLSASLMTL
jgi:hypothetical protein